ncbi:hypothetical protein Taro_003027 [Colocasia esculenta]|uniref:Staygreen protein domain-containing protein n=1 Tax=Colocasia esculenta TaxID=4460 RepID=A0A843TQK2_COLES|nr:hypothetical protein [Colocasia esculenta]
MGSAAAALFLPPATQIGGKSSLELKKNSSGLLYSRKSHKVHRPTTAVVVARLFGPAIFEASKLKVLFLGVDQARHPGHLPRAYTLTHSDITAKLTLAVSHTINGAQLQGWYNRLQRDEVVAEWKKVKGKMSLHVHCHISGGHFLLDFIAKLRYYIFTKELPVVLKAFVHGDVTLFNAHPELEEALVWVYFHSNLPEYNKVECWGPLREAAASAGHMGTAAGFSPATCPAVMPLKCQADCTCCFPPHSLIPWPQEFEQPYAGGSALPQQQQQ